MSNCRTVMISLMMVGSRLYSINVNYTSEMIFLPLVIIYGDKAPFVEKPFLSAIFLDVLNLFIMQVLLDVLLLQF